MRDNQNDFDMFADERNQSPAPVMEQGAPIPEQGGAVTEQQVAVYLAKVMGWMCVGLLTTLVSAMLCLSSGAVMNLMFGRNAVFGIFIAQLVVVAGMSFYMHKMSAGVATVMFMVYSALTGVTFSALYLLFEMSSIIYVFGITAVTFVALSVYGFVTKRDLTRIGSLAMCGLIGIIVAGIANYFLGSSMLNFGITVVGIIIFIALTAYDTQRIKAIYLDTVSAGYHEESPEVRKLAIYGALTLYLDFINLFLKLLRLLGRRRS